MKKPEGIRNELAYLIASLNRQLEEELSEKLRPEGIPIEQFRVLSILSESDGRPMGELAELVFVDPTTLTKIVDRMVTDTLVYRAPAPGDRRKILIFIAPGGQATFRRLQGLVKEQSQQLAERLPPDQAKQLRFILQGLART